MKSIYKTLLEVSPVISTLKLEKVGNTNDTFRIYNWNIAIEELEKLKDIEAFQNDVQKLFSISPIFADKTDNLNISSSQYNSFVAWHKDIINKIKIIIEVCETLGYGKYKGSFEVKLPETNDFNEFSENINELRKFIQICPFINNDENNIKIIKTDIGSTWVEFLVEGSKVIPVLIALGYFVKSALVIKSMYLTCEQQKEAVRGAMIKADLAENITNMYKDIVKATAVNEIKKIEESLERALEPEERNSAEKSLDILGKLMSKGLEVYATLDAPQEAKNVFPSSTEQKLLSGPQKLLTDNSNED